MTGLALGLGTFFALLTVEWYFAAKRFSWGFDTTPLLLGITASFLCLLVAIETADR